MRGARVLLVLLLVLLAACARSNGDLPDVQVDLAVAPMPLATGASTITARLADANNAPLASASVTFEATMTHAGMAPTSANASETQPGVYQAPITFDMAGDWVIIVRARLPDGRSLERPVTIGSVRSP